MEHKRNPEWNNLTQRLENYKQQQKDRATKKNVLEKFMKARTLTQARKILKGGL